MSEIFEKSLADYFSKHSKLEFLGLEFPNYELRFSGEIEFICFGKGHKHKVYSDDGQQNFISDCNLAILRNQQDQKHWVNLGSKLNLKHFHLLHEENEELKSRITELENAQKKILEMTLKIAEAVVNVAII